MLLGNYTPLSANPGRCITHAIPNPYKWRSSGNMYSFYTGDAVVDGETEKSSFNNGYVPPYSWVLAPVAGGLGSINEINGDSEFTSSMAMGINILSDITGVGQISSANLSMIVGLLADLAGSGTLSSSMVGVVQMAADLVGQGNVIAGINLLANCVASLNGVGAVTAGLRGDSYMSADIYVNQSTATTNELVYAIWNAIATQFNVAGTMGNKLNGAGSAGDPWTTDLTSYTTDGTAGKKLKELKNPSLIIDGEVII